MSAANVTVTVALLRANNVTGLPISVVSTVASIVALSSTPGWVSLAAPFSIDVSGGERAFAIALSASQVSKNAPGLSRYSIAFPVSLSPRSPSSGMPCPTQAETTR